MRTLQCVIGGLAALLLQASLAAAQAEPAVGVRAAGMAGAFTGVADDASAVYWNPAGLASGAFFSFVADRSQFKATPDNPFSRKSSPFLLALGTPPLGASFARLPVAVAPATAAGSAGRNTAEALVTQQFGVTLDHSLRDGLAVGATLKGVRAAEPAGSATAFDVDLGIMASGALGRAGLAVRNALQPEFTETGGIVRVQRRVRAGVSLLVRQAVTVAADGDFTTAATPVGRWRDAAIGAEAHPFTRAWVRGGVHWNTAGGSRGPGAAPVFAVGASATLYGSLLADAQVSAGSEQGERGWGVGLRFAF